MGQADRHDVLVGMRFGTIDGKPYKKELLDAKIAGSQDYEVRFVRPQETHPAVLTWASWALPRMGHQGLVFWHEHQKVVEARKIQAQEKNNPIGQCYQGVNEIIWYI